jgi:hypothetical protein
MRYLKLFEDFEEADIPHGGEFNYGKLSQEDIAKVKSFIEDLKIYTKEHGVKLILSPDTGVQFSEGGFMCNGYFDGDTSGTYYVVVSSTVPQAGNTIVTLKNSLDNVFTTNTRILFYQQTQLRASGQTFEFVGAGTTLTSALPRNGGIPNNAAQIVRTNDGAVFCTSTNENGDFQVSDLIIEQATGTVSGRTFSKSLYAEMTPFILALEG